MEKNINKALKDLSIIKNCIEESKNSNIELHKIFLLFTITNFSYFSLTTLEHIFISKIHILGYTNLGISLLLYFFAFKYFKKLKNENKNNRKAYLIFLDICQFTLLLLPILCTILRLFLFLPIFNNNPVELLEKIELFSMFLNIILLCFSFNIVRYIFKDNSSKFLALSIFITFSILILFFNENILIFSNITLSISKLYYYLIISIGYGYLTFLSKNMENKKWI